MTDDTALSSYLARGWSVVPIHYVLDNGSCTCRLGAQCPEKNRGKHPVYKNWQKLTLSADAVMSIYRQSPRLNVGIATGRPSGFWAMDIDSPSALEALTAEFGAIPPPLQRTGSGGAHVLFEMPRDFEPTNSPGRLPAGIDVRGTGGQIVVPPSVSGRGAYTLLDHALTVHPNPPWLLELIRPAAYSPRESASPPVDMSADTPDARRAAAYAMRAMERSCAELAGEQHTRNARAFSTACRLHELINAGWLNYEGAEEEYLAAAEQASGNKPEPFTEREARQVWANAAQRVGESCAELPPSALGGERLDFTGTIAGTLSSPPAVVSSSDSLDQMLLSGVSLSMGSQTSPVTYSGAGSTHPEVPPQLNLPAEFWEARPVLKHIRDAAHARLVSADVAFYTVLARLAAMWPHQIRLNSGVRSPAAANCFVAVVGPSGAGKTSGVGVAEDLLERPPWLEHDTYADGLPLGTGEGLAEAYMGTRKVPKVDDLGVPVQDRDGATKTVSVRAQVRHNAFFYADEGEALAKLIERNGSTIGETLRRAWVGSTIGSANGRAETTRIIEKGRYSLGMLIGFQLDTAQHLLADVKPGTPQRFLWAWALDPGIPEHPISHPGPLRGVWPAQQGPPGSGPWLIDPGGADLREVTYPREVLDELWREAQAVGSGRLVLPEYDSHRPLHMVKLSALLAQLEGRRDVSAEDWRLAAVIWRTSSAVRDHVLRYGVVEQGKASAAKRAALVGDHTAVELARLEIAEQHDQVSVGKTAVWAVRYIAENGPKREPELRRKYSRRAQYIAEALTLACAQQWLVADGDSYTIGPVRI